MIHTILILHPVMLHPEFWKKIKENFKYKIIWEEKPTDKCYPINFLYKNNYSIVE